MKSRIFCLLAGSALLTLSLHAQVEKKGNVNGKSGLASQLPSDARQLALGDAAPDFLLKGVDGKMYSLADFASAPVLMVVFLSNHCPYSHAAETRLLPLAREFQDKGLAVVAINPNSPDGIELGELGYSKYNDSFAEMVLYAKEEKFPFPYVYDGETQHVAKAYGCLATPHVFLFNRERKLCYVGRVDDSRFSDPATVKSADARNAVIEMLAGKPVTVASTKVMGCSTKWNSKRGEVAKADEKWNRQPVNLAKIDAGGVADLAKNPTNRYRLINVWATWCGPCVAEFPQLESLARRLSARDFEFVSISLDDPKQEAQAKKFLEKNHASPSPRLEKILKAEGRDSVNFIYTGENTDALINALDAEWAGPLPHTLLIAPGGKVIYRHTGEVNFEELQAKIIEQLGVYYN